MIYNYSYYLKKLDFFTIREKKKKKLNNNFFVIYSTFIYKNTCFIIYLIPLY